MYLVTNDPIQYLMWIGILMLVLIVGALFVAVIKIVYRSLKWILTKPPTSFSDGDLLRIRTGEMVRVRYVNDKGEVAITINPYAMLSELSVVKPSELRKF